MDEDKTKKFNVEDWEILTVDGWKDFKGVNKYNDKESIKLTFEDKTELICSPNHELMNKDGEFIYAKDSIYVFLKTETGGKQVILIEDAGVRDLYDVTDVEGGHFIANGIVSHNCGMLKEFWASVFPIISSKKRSKIIMASTPRDTSGLFYKLYDGSVKGENEWVNLKIRWDEIPGRDEKWKQQILGSLGDPALFEREFCCEFDNVGDAEIDMDTFELLKRECMLPLYSLEEECYKIWENADESRLYVAGVDVAEGIGRDYTVIQILDITDIRQIKQVACYANNRISPIEFTPKLREILKDWGDPLVLIEANNCGSVPVNNLKKDFSYENIVNWGISKVANAYDRQKLGIVSHTNTKFTAVKNMKYFINTMKRVKLYDTVTVNELKDFVKNKSGTYSAKHGSHDDRVMALVWALMILHADLVGKYFDVQEYDEHQQALHIKPIDFGINYFMNPTSIYDKAKGGGDALPLFISQMREPSNMELDDLYIDGWHQLGN